MRFSFLGVGNMGAPLARNILLAGEALTIFTRRPEGAAAFAADGATVANSVRELADCDVLCTCVPLPEHVREAVLGADGAGGGLYAAMRPGSIHLEFSTIDPATANELARAAAEKGIAYVQATVAKTPQMAMQREEPLFVGGDRAAVRTLWPILEKVGKPTDVESVDASCAVKLLSNMIGMANLAVLAEGMRIGAAAGMKLKTLLPLLQDTGARSFQMDVRGPWMAAGDFSPRFAVDLAAKDLRLGCAMARGFGCEARLTEEALAMFRAAQDKGLGGEDACAVFKAAK
ncbi:MAG: NAD(P)-dependent oxidoreductase [Desulfovibrio sp.]|nr:NAD(P)-dependent oxidoreductase [Desulfovibrio sp.]